MLGLTETVCEDKTKCKSSVTRHLREGWVCTYTWAQKQPFRVDLSNKRTTSGTPDSILRRLGDRPAQPDDRRSSSGPVGSRGRRSRSPRRGDRRRPRSHSRGRSINDSPKRSRRGSLYSRSPSGGRRDSRRDGLRCHSGKRRASRSLSRDRKYESSERQRSSPRCRDSASTGSLKRLGAPVVPSPVVPARPMGNGQAGTGGWYKDTNGEWKWFDPADNLASKK